MSWQQLQANHRVQTHSTSRRELEELRAIVERDLKDARVPGSCPQDGHIIEAELRIVRDHR